MSTVPFPSKSDSDAAKGKTQNASSSDSQVDSKPVADSDLHENQLHADRAHSPIEGGPKSNIIGGSHVSAGESPVSPSSQEGGAGRGRLGTAMGMQIIGTGHSVPDNLVTNDDLAKLGCDSDWIVRRTGIRQRYHATEGQSTGDLAYEASVKAIESAGIDRSEIDLVVVATMTPDHLTPSTACGLQRRLGLFAPAMDLSAACAGFTYGLVTAGNFLAAGNAKNALVVGADLMSRTIDPSDKKTFPLFADGAGAVVLGSDPSKQKGILAYQLGSEGDDGEMLCIPAGGTRMPITPDNVTSSDRFMQMDGRNVFKWAVKVVDESCRQAMEHAGVQASEIDHLILHQANRRIIDSAVRDLGIAAERVFLNLDRFGNTSAATIPIAIDEIRQQGNWQEGQTVMLCGFGSGLVFGTTVLRL